MSCCEIYVIRPNGDVELFGEARNAWGGAIELWNRLSEKHLGRPFDMFKLEGNIWEKFGHLPEPDNTLLGFTFDGVWIKKENIQRLIDAFEQIPATSTIACITEYLRDALKEDIRGVCFNQTSVCENPWSVYNKETEESRPFNFDTDKADIHGKKPWELFEKK